MANKVVGFSIEINGQKQIEATTKLLGLLNTQAILLNNTIKDLEKSGINLSKDLKLTGDSAQKMSKVMKDSFKTFDEGNKVVTDLGNGYFEVTKAIEKEAKVIKETTKEELIALEIKRKIARENKQVAKQEAIIQTETKNNIASLRAQLSLTTLEWKKFTVEELKNTEAGRKVAADKKRLTALLLKEEKATGDARRQVGFYEKATANLGKTLLKLSVGRDIIRGIFEGFRTVIEDGKESNQVFKQISDSFERLKAFAVSLATAFLNVFGGTISTLVDNFSFAIFKVSEAFKSVANSGGLFGDILSTIGTVVSKIFGVFLEFPATIAGVIEVFKEFGNIAGRTISEIGLNLQKVSLNVQRAFKVISGGSVKEIDNAISDINKKLQENVINARGLGTAYEEGFNNAKKAQEEFNKSLDEQAKNDSEAQKEAREKRKAAAEELKKERATLLTDIQAQNIARIELIKDLSSELKQAEIANIADQTQAAIAAEKERFELSKEARKKNFEETLKEIEREELELIKLFGFSSKEFEKFEEESGLQLLQIQENNNAISEQEAIKHQETLLKITKDGEKALLDAKQKAFEDDLAEAEAEYDELNSAREEYYEKQIRISIEAGKKLEEENKKSREAAKDTAIELINTTFSVINDLVAIANDAENQRFDDAIERRQQTISKLSEDLENATGLQKKFLQRQIAQEEEALKKETIIKEKALKKQAETQKAIAISQAVVNGALGVTGILGGQISGNPVVDAVLKAALIAALVATTATEIAVISSQKFAKGGFTGQGTTRDETGHKVAGVVHDNEYVVPKSILQTSKGSTLVSELESMRIGKIPKFATGGFTSPIMTAPVLANNQSDSNNKLDTFIDAAYSMADATNRRIDRLQVVQDLNNLNDIQQNALNLKQQTTIS
jgi:hypothetical protein